MAVALRACGSGCYGWRLGGGCRDQRAGHAGRHGLRGRVVGETLALYMVILFRDLRRTLSPRRHTLTALLVEFGPAEVLDTFAVRPLAMPWGPCWSVTWRRVCWPANSPPTSSSTQWPSSATSWAGPPPRAAATRSRRTR